MAASEIKFTALTSRGDVLATELNALANGSASGVSGSGTGLIYDNTTNRQQLGVFRLSVDFVSAPSAFGFVEVYCVESYDGTNYQDATTVANDLGKMRYLGTIQVGAVTPAQVIMSPWNFVLRPVKMKFVLRNQTGQAFPATGSTLGLYTFGPEAQ